MAAPPLLTLATVAKRRGGQDRSFELRVPRLELRAGEAVALMGPSGCGKSTLIDLVALALAPDVAGDFTLALPGQPPLDVLAAWREGRSERLARARAAGFGYVLQTGGLLPFLDVAGNVGLPLAIQGRRDPERVRALAERLGIAPLLGARPEKLSVGQRQRVAIARALAARPPLLLADEPTASLDPGNAEAVMRLLLDATAAEGAALVLATHDAALARAFGLPLRRFELEERENGVVAWLTEPAP